LRRTLVRSVRCAAVILLNNSLPEIMFMQWPKQLFLRPNAIRPRSTMDSIRVSEAPDPGSIPGEATLLLIQLPSLALLFTSHCIKSTEYPIRAQASTPERFRALF
jgi:hypothetical protein